MSIRALIIIVFAGLAACAATPSQLTNIPLADPIAIPTNEAECSAAGQLWVEQGLPGGSKSCAVRTSDARKICTNSNQCQGECLVEGSQIGRESSRERVCPYVEISVVAGSLNKQTVKIG